MRMRGEGTIYRRASDGRWIFAVNIDGHRRTLSDVRLCSLMAAVRASGLSPDRHIGRPRVAAMIDARAKGTHTASEWFTYIVSRGWRCEYCDRRCRAAPTKDHRTPVSRGGSDGLENLALACAACNWRKASLTEDEFRALLRAEPSLMDGILATPIRRRSRPRIYDDGAMSVEEAARALCTGQRRIRTAIREGRLRAKMAGVAYRITPEAIADYFNALPTNAEMS